MNITSMKENLKNNIRLFITHTEGLNLCTIIMHIGKTLLLSLFLGYFYYTLYGVMDANTSKDPLVVILNCSVIFFKPFLALLICFEFIRCNGYILYRLIRSSVTHTPASFNYRGWITISTDKEYKHPLLDKLFRSSEDKASFEKENELISIHEAGHAVAAYLLDIPVNYVSMSEAYTAVTFPPIKYAEELEKEIQIFLAGKVAEYMICNKISTVDFEEQSDFSVAKEKLEQYHYLLLLTHKENVSSADDSSSLKDILYFIAKTETLLSGKEELIRSVAAYLRKSKLLSGENLSSLLDDITSTSIKGAAV